MENQNRWELTTFQGVDVLVCRHAVLVFRALDFFFMRICCLGTELYSFMVQYFINRNRSGWVVMNMRCAPDYLFIVYIT